MIVRELITLLGFDIEEEKLKKFDAAVTVASRQVNKLRNDIEGVGLAVKRLGFGMTAFVTTPLALMGFGMVKAASDAEETSNKFSVVFDGLQKESEETAKSFADDFGIAISTSEELISNTGDLLVGFGFTRKAALKMSNDVQRLAGDLASFQNIQGGVREAGERLTKGILGETENLKLMGIAVNQGSKEFRAMVKNIMAVERVTERQAKVLAVYRVAVSQSQNAIGDFARTSQSFSNQLKIFRERVKTLAIEFGNILLPVATKILRVFSKIIKIFSNLPTPLKKIIVFLSTFVAIIGPVLFIIGSLIASFGFLILKIVVLSKIFAFFGLTSFGVLFKLSTLILGFLTRISLLRVAFVLLSKAVLAVVIPMSILLAKIIAVAAIVGLLIDDIVTWVQGGDSAIGVLLGTFENFKNRVSAFVNEIKQMFSNLWMALTTGSQDAWDDFKNNLSTLIVSAFKAFDKLLEKAIQIAPQIVKVIVGVFVQLFKIIFLQVIPKLIKLQVIIIRNLFKFIGQEIGNLLTSGVNFALDKIKNKFPVVGRFLSKASKLTGATAGPRSPSEFLASQVKPEALASGVGKTRVNRNEFKMSTDVTIQVPQGTTREQEMFLEEKAKVVVEDAIQKSVNQAIIANPVVE